MRPVVFSIAALLAASLATGCSLKAAPTAAPLASAARSANRHPKGQTMPASFNATGATTVEGAGSSLAAGNPSAIVANNSGTLISNNGGALISNNSGSLIGTVRAPASLISNNGGSLVMANVSGLVSNNGGGLAPTHYGVFAAGSRYGLLELPAQVPVAAAQVRLLDAANQPVKGPDGQPLVVTTDVEGHYAFQAALPGQNLLVQVVLPNQKGSLQAVATRASTSTRRADLDLVSTLTTTYILDQYVKGQKDPVATLEKLPADVEATTRTKAGAAYAASGAATPFALFPAQIDATVASLRQSDASFDQQMETVKKLLIVAGQSDLGAGRLGTDVTIGWASSLALGPDGTLFIACPGDNRVWKLGSDGRINTAVGVGTPAAGSLDGKVAAQAGLGSPSQLGFDASGRLLVLENPGINLASGGGATRLSALQPDGTLADAWPGMGAASAFWPRANGDVWVLMKPDTVSPNGKPAAIWVVPASGAPHLLHAFSAQQNDPYFAYVQGAGVDKAGNLYFNTQAPDANGSMNFAGFRIDPQTFAIAQVGASADPLAGRVLVDATGDVLGLNTSPSSGLQLYAPGNPKPSAPAGLPSATSQISAFQTAPGGALFASLDDGIYRLANGVATRLVGATSAPASKASDLSLQSPGVPLVGKDGALYVPDSQLMKIFKFPSSGASSVLIDMSIDNVNVWILRQDAAGLFYVTQTKLLGQRLQKFADGGTPQDLLVCTADEVIDDFVVAADGTVYASVSNQQPNTPTQLERVAPGKAPEVLTPLAGSSSLALAGDGTLYAAGMGNLSRWMAAGGLQSIKNDARFGSLSNNPPNPALESSSRLALDGQGRLYLTDASANTITRFDPKAGTFTPIAGLGSPNFNGTGVNTGLFQPFGPVIDPAGNLLFSDNGHKQIKRIPAAQL